MYCCVLLILLARINVAYSSLICQLARLPWFIRRCTQTMGTERAHVWYVSANNGFRRTIYTKKICVCKSPKEFNFYYRICLCRRNSPESVTTIRRIRIRDCIFREPEGWCCGCQKSVLNYYYKYIKLQNGSGNISCVLRTEPEVAS